MVMRSSTRRGIAVSFKSWAPKHEEAFFVGSLRGQEAISQPYRFDLELISPKDDVDSDAVLYHHATLGFKHGVSVDGGKSIGVQTSFVQGMVASLEQCEKSGGWVAYRAVFVPRLWRLSLTSRSQVFVKKSVPEIVEQVLWDNKFVPDDYEFHPDLRKCPPREYVVQYQESDLNFVSRLLEHEGIFYFFRQDLEDKGGEKIVFADSSNAYESVSGTTAVRYSTASIGGGTQGRAAWADWLQEDVISQFTCRHSKIPAQVVLNDYNYRTPTVKLQVDAPVTDKGFGLVYEYGTHYQDPEEGKVLAQIRAQEIQCREKIFPGTSNHRGFHAGATFELRQHYRSDFNHAYLLTEVWHRTEQTFDLSSGKAAVQEGGYENEFTCIPADRTYRPPRVTPRPKIPGAVNAHVDAAGSGKYAELDDLGRYHVKLKSDLSDEKDGQASHWIRMAEPYGGPGYGAHWPVHKSAEVILTHENGDPDRPIIASAAPNPVDKSPVVGENQSQCVIKTEGGNEMRMEDLEDAKWIHLFCPQANTHISMGADHHSEHQPPGVTVATEKGISINAGQGIGISAGAATHDAGSGKSEEHTSTIKMIAEIASGLILPACASGAEMVASGVLKGLASAAMHIYGAIQGHSLPGISLSAPGAVYCTTPAEIVLGGKLSATLVAKGPANVVSISGCLVGGAMGVAVVSVKNVEVVSIIGDVKVEAKWKGNVIVEAKKNVKVHAHTHNIEMEAKQNVYVYAGKDYYASAKEGFATLLAQKDIAIESTKEGKIELKTGNSKIVMQKDGITISSPTINIVTKEGKATLDLSDKESIPFLAHSKGQMELLADKENALISKTTVLLGGDDVVEIKTPNLNEKGAKEINRANSKEA